MHKNCKALLKETCRHCVDVTEFRCTVSGCKFSPKLSITVCFLDKITLSPLTERTEKDKNAH